MKGDIALRVLADIMNWDNATARQEYGWLSLMSRMKYDGYRDFLAGVRFAESLADWLQQFERMERQAAYDFVRKALVYMGPTEMQHLVELVYPEVIRTRLVAVVARKLSVPTHFLWAQEQGPVEFASALRRTLFLGLSDGARMDAFRRANVGLISNEQVAIATQLDKDKWDSLLNDLRADQHDDNSRFEFVCLLDDFVGSGTTLLRRKPTGGWTGKLPKFWQHIQEVRQTHFSQNLNVCVHHYVSSYAASIKVQELNQEATAELGNGWFPSGSIHFSFGTVLPEDLPVDEARFPGFMQLVQKYYDPSIQSRHTAVGGGVDVRLGFGNGALPLVLEHNTPNNSIALLWADTDGSEKHPAMRPLFRRRQRHV